MTPTSTLTRITPTVATNMLARNVGNRPVRKQWVKQLAHAMETGDFITTHQGIAFDDKGQLLDGQHRLMAVVESGCEIEMLVTKNLDPTTFSYLDRGVKRSDSDALRVSKKVSEVTSLAVRMAVGRLATHAETADVHRLVGPIAEDLVAYCGATVKVFSCASMKLAAVYSVLKSGRRDYVFGTYRDLCMGNVDELPTIGKSVVKQLVRGHLSSKDKGDLLGRGLVVFDKKNSHLTRVQIKDEATATEEVRSFLRKRLGLDRTSSF